MKRLFDILTSTFVLILCLPLGLVVALLIKINSKGPVFYKQKRIGKDFVPFGLYKFRSMRIDSDKGALITVGERDPRITSVGYYLRKYKLDELPQLINILKGDMSVVGPRPEVKKYVDLYKGDQKNVLSVRPGLTDWASIKYFDENALLAEAKDPEKMYIETIMPSKLALNLKYIKEASLMMDIKIIFKTFMKILR